MVQHIPVSYNIARFCFYIHLFIFVLIIFSPCNPFLLFSNNSNNNNSNNRNNNNNYNNYYIAHNVRERTRNISLSVDSFSVCLTAICLYESVPILLHYLNDFDYTVFKFIMA